MARPGTADSASDLPERFSVLVAYENTQAHHRARRLCERLLSRFWGEMDLDISWWSFDFLRDAAMAEAAANAAANAQLILFSVHTHASLPASVQGWMEAWLCLRQAPGGALAVLIEEASPLQAPQAVIDLRRAAERAQMDFLQEGIVEPATALEKLARAEPDPKGHVTATLRKMLSPHSRPSHWGINE